MKSVNHLFSFLLISSVLMASGCGGVRDQHSFLGHHKNKHALVRDYVPTCNEPILEAAKCITQFEDGLRMDGTITVKTPDVWGDANLMHSIQEFDKELLTSLPEFENTLQAFVANLDRASGLNEITAAVSPSAAPDATPPTLPTATVLEFKGGDTPFAALAALPAFAQPKSAFQIEPTESERQHATYVHLNQALRRRSMGGDNTRQAGYGLYLFRIPVSVLPGEETSEGYSAVANLRARLVTTQADVKYTLPRMAIADMVEAMTESILANWKVKGRDKTVVEAISKPKKNLVELEKFGIIINDSTKDRIAVLEYSCTDLSNEQIKAEAKEINVQLKDQLKPQLKQLVKWVKEMEKINEMLASNRDDPLGQIAELKNTWNDTSKMIARPSRVDLNRSLASADEKNNWLNDFRSEVTLANEFAETVKGGFLDGKFNQENLTLQMATALSPVGTFNPPPKPFEIHVAGTAQLATAGYDVNDAIAVREHLKTQFKDLLKNKPRRHELRRMMFDALHEINNHIEKLDGYDIRYHNMPAIQFAASELESGRPNDEVCAHWQGEFKNSGSNPSYSYLKTAWLLARQCGLVDLNIRRMMKEMVLRGDLAQNYVDRAAGLNFFSNYQLAEATRIWQRIVEKEFPLQVFTLEPLVEEQNLVDALSRQRQMQFALAYSVSQSNFNVQQKVSLSQQLARDSAAIGLNRTVVGFAHGMDTFGWYFHPRIQSPETKVRNKFGAFRQLNTTVGPTRAEDRSTFRLEPGVRDCEVLIAMPSFVTQVDFDVTTNWESLAQPGRAKRSYEEMIAQGCQLQKVKDCLMSCFECGTEFREGDFIRLHSRVEQLEQMLGMQTHRVELPFEYEQPAVELFSQGDQNLVPQAHDFYGLSTLFAENEEKKVVTAEFFITGRNFHPTLTHVVVGGHESDSIGTEQDVEILSRELIRVRTKLITDKLAGDNFEVRVGTPQGLSNSLTIPKTAKKKDDPKSAFDWNVQPKFAGFVFRVPGVAPNPPKPNVDLASDNTETEFFKITSDSKNPLKIKDFKNGGSQQVEMRIVYEIKFKDETIPKRPFNGETFTIDPVDKIDKAFLEKQIKKDLEFGKNLRLAEPEEATITGTTYIRLDNWPLIKFDKTIEIKLKPPIQTPWP